MPTIFATATSRVLQYLTDYREVRRKIGLRWWVEIIIIGVCYFIYSMIRNYLGSDNVTWEVAFDNAKTIIEIERYLGLYQELRIQEWFIDWEPFIRFWNIFYGLFQLCGDGLCAVLAVCALSRPFCPLAHHWLGHHRAGAGRLCHLSFDASPSAGRRHRCLRGRHV